MYYFTEKDKTVKIWKNN